MKSSSRLWFVLAGVVLVAGAVAIAVVNWHQPKKQAEPQPTANTPPIKFTDATDTAGIRFQHVSGATPKKLLPETMGSGVAVIDYDRDGHPDLLFVNSRPWPGQTAPAGIKPTMALYHNKGDGTFEDVTKAAGLDIEMYGLGVAVGDYDNDGWPDLFITAVGGNRLFHNVGGNALRK